MKDKNIKIDNELDLFKEQLKSQQKSRSNLYKKYVGETDTYDAPYINQSDQNSLRSNLQDKYASDKDDSSWYSGVLDFVTSMPEDFVNSGRMFTKKLIDQFIDSDMAAIDDVNQEQSDLEKIEDYRKLHQELKQLKSTQFDELGFRINTEQKQKRIYEIEQKIKEYDNYFMGEGRSHTVIAQQMFDTNKMDALDEMYINSAYINKNTDKTNYIDGSIGGFFNQIGANALNVLSSAEGAIDWVITTGGQAISNLFGQGSSVNGYKTGEVIKRLDSNNEQDRMFLNKLYKGSFLNVGDVVESIDENRIKQWKEYNSRRINELTAELKSDIEFSKDGKIFGIDIYDPEDIPQQFKDEQEKFGDSFWNYLNPYKGILYTLPEVASTVGLAKYQVEATGVNGLLAYVSRELPVWAIGPGKFGKLLQFVEKTAPGLMTTTVEAGAIGSGIAAAKASRRDETSLESINALGSRVAKIVENNGGDVQKIANAVHDRGLKMGIDTSDWNLDRIMKFALVYNINTGDEVFDSAKNDARKGLNKLTNANNALAIVDYLQALPFMSYSGSAMKNWATGMNEKATGLFGISTNRYGSYIPKQAVIEKSKPIMQAVSDATVGRAANKFIKDGAIKTGLFIKHSGEYALNKMPLIAGEAFSEGLEEINQELLQSKYQRGLYDEYNRTPSILDINEVFDNVNLSFEGLAAYAAITPWDPDLSIEDVRKAFHIGAASSAMFAGLLRALGNFRSSDDPNMRNLIAQLKNDKHVANIVSNYYNQVQDQKHLELFFDAFTKAGVDRRRLQKSLSDLKDVVDEENTLVRKDFIDSDIQLMNAAWGIFDNKKINDLLKENGVEKYGDQHKQIVVDGAVAIVENQKNQEKIQEGTRKMSEMQQRHIDVVSEMLSSLSTPERIKQLEQENPELANIVVSLKNDYDDYKTNRENSQRGKFGAFSKSFDSVKKFLENEGVRDYITTHGLSSDTVSKEDEEGYDPLESEARRIFANTKERKAALKYAYEYQNRKEYGELLQEERAFSRNKYIRQYARSQVTTENFLDSKLRELYEDKQKREDAISKAFELYNNGTYSLNDYVIERIHLLHNHMNLQRLQYARDVAADKHRRNMEIRKRTGLDTYTGLEGIVRALDEEIKHYKKVEDRQLNRKDTPENQKLTWADLFKGKDFRFDDQQEFDQEFSTLALNRAINGPQRILAAAYLIGRGNPVSLHDAIFGEQSNQDVLAGIKSQYTQILSEEEAAYDQESDTKSLNNEATRRHDKDKLEKQAAWTIIENRLKENLQRKRIANRIFEEEGPITPSAEERQQEEQEQLQQEGESTQEQGDKNVDEEKTTQQEAPMSDAEKRLNEKYNHQKGEQKTLHERVEERRKRRQAAVVEDGLEESENEVQTIDDGGEQEVENLSEEAPEEASKEASTRKQLDDKKEPAKEVEDQENDTEFAPEEPFDLNDGEEDDTEFIPEEIDQEAEQSIRDSEAATAEFEEEAKTNATVLENGWVLIEDYSGLEFNDEGFLMYDGEILPPEQQQYVMDDITLLQLSEQLGFSQEDLPDGTKRQGEDDRLTSTNSQLTDLISQTFFYKSEPEINEETGKDELPKMTVNGEEVKFDKPLASGRQLAKKLSQPGWLGSTKKYFIVTQSEQGKNVAKNKDVRDAMTIALVIEDENNSYVTFLRSLGLTESEGYGPHGSISVDSETAGRNWLLSRHVDWNKVLQTIGDGQYSYIDRAVFKNGSKYPLTSSQKVALYQQAVAKIAMDRAKQGYYANTGSYDGFEHWYTNDPIRSDFKDDETWQKAVAERKRTRKLYTDRARQSLALAGKNIFSEEQVDKQINDLREFRNRIIDAYLTKETKNGNVTYKFPSKIKKSVIPSKVIQSNGKINNQKDKFRNPIYRTINNPNASIEEIQQQLESGEITLGYGLGMFANDQDRFAIRGLLDSQATTQFNGRGLSGKIYWMVKGPAGAQTRIPIMLAEEKFDTQVQIVNGKPRTVYLNNPKNLVLCLKRDPVTGKFENINTEGYQPSAAEIIFYMLINQMSVGLDAERHAEMVEFFIHNDEKTLLKNQPKSGSDPFNVLGKKQLSFHTVDNQQVLTIGLKDENGKYVARSFTVEQMMLQTEDGEQLRRQIVNAIATQMHWNTDLAHMNSSINVLGTSNTSVAQLFRWAIDNFAEDLDDVQKYLNQRVSIFGCPQLSFRIGDFFDKRGNDIVPKTDVSILAWMIKEGKIKTDAGEQLFTAPFVFANGVQVEGGQIETEIDKVVEASGEDSNSNTINITTPSKAPKKQQKKQKPVETVTAFNLSDENVYNEMVSEWRPGLEDRRKREGWFVAKTEEERQRVRESIDQTKDAKDNGGINDRIMIRAPREKISQDKAVEQFRKVLEDFLDKYNKQYPDKAVDPNSVNINDLAEDQIKTQWALKKGYIILDLYKNKKAKVQVRRDADFGNWRNPVTGVFSKTIGGSGTLKFEKARKWLSDTLGIDPDNIVLTNAVMRSTTDESVYGLTNVALDRIAGEVTGYMKFSQYADEGIEYHEAWHYVNLLMHDKETRTRIYKSYIKSHKALDRPGVKIKDVEEAMADDFKVYMEGFTDKSISGKIRRLFSNILDFLIASRRKSEYRIAFKAIANGEYSAAKLDSASVSEFQNRYRQGIFYVQHSVAGLSKAELDKMTNIRTYQDIFDGTNAIINRVFSVLDLTSPKKMQAVANSGFGKVLQIVDDMIGEQSDENKIAKLQDIRSNERFLRKALIDAFMELGIVAKVRKSSDVRKTERNEINEDALKKEDDPDNTWDKFTLSSQRKENASLNTKMFLRQIPVYQKQYLDDGSVQYNLDRDDYGTVKMYDSDQAWRKIIDTLWMCDSYSEMDENGKYSPTSIMGIVESHKNIDPFFYSLFIKLQDLDMSGEFGDTQLKSQILTTVNSSKTQVQIIIIQNPKEAKPVAEEELFTLSDEEYGTLDDNGVVADKRREWIIRNDSLVSVARNLPRIWSKNLASNGLLGFNGVKGESVVDRNFVQSVEKDLNSIQKTIVKYTSAKKKGFVPKSSEELQHVLDELKPRIIDFYNKLGIESDLPSLNVYIAMMSEINGELTPQQQIDSLQKIFNTSSIGSISYIVDGLVENIGNSEVTHSGSKYSRAIDEAFSEYAADSHIGVLALAWNAVHPSSQEFSVKDANDNRLYPINLNNYISDRVRAMNDRRSGYIRKMQKASYCKHSIIADAANKVQASNPKSKIKLNTFVGIRDANSSIGADYFGITAAEDYLAKLCMTEDDQIIFPTMADKKTWNSISSENINLTHDTVLISPLDRDIRKYIYQEYENINPYDKNKYTHRGSWELEARRWYRSLDKNDESRINITRSAAFDLGAKRASSVGFDLDVNNGYVTPRFSDTTLNRFAGYFLDELNAVIDYYNKENIQVLVKNKNKRIENYHGKVENGRMDFSGNGGKFRYLYDIPFPGMKYNLNHTLQGLFELQKKIESGQVLNKAKEEGDINPYIGTDVLNTENPDGFELIREYLEDLKKTYFKKGGFAKQELLDAINRKLVDQTEDELYRISRPGSPLQLVEYNSKTGFYTPKGIPEQLLDRYTKILQEANYGSFGKAYDSEDLLHHALFSLIGSHVANTATSVIEVEKIFAGDPAFYKKKALEYKSKITIDRTFDTGEIAIEEVEVENLYDVFSDKIKRLGGTLSPGQELRLDFTEDELAFDPTLKCTKYTNLNVEDIKLPSLFLEEIEDQFKKQLLVDIIRSNTPKGFATFLTDLQNERKKTNERLIKEGKKSREEITVERAIDIIYSDSKSFQKMWELLTDKERQQIETMLEQQMHPYKNITVSDAQVFIRPDLYRKIRISLGQWSFEPDESGYSDEEAYNIIEGITINSDGTRTKELNPNDLWSRDPELYKKVQKLQLFPLKMSYFQNDTEQVTEDIIINKPIYNKMAIFPLFAFQRSTSVGKALYERMNKPGNELDMVSFKSAVKVGAIQKGAQLAGSKDVVTAMSDLNEQLNQQSNIHLDYTTGEVISGVQNSTLGITVQDLANLRMQLNTQAHEAELRAIGTQMFKIAFSNIIDDAIYGTGKSGRSVRKGSTIKRDIISCINALTRIGIDDIRDRFYKDGHLDNKAVQEFVETVVKNNGLGSSAEEIISNGGTAAGVISRTVFENSASSIVNSDIVDINTKGGTAIQQSVYGFVGYGNNSVGTLSYNSGRELKWSALEGSMQVMLSMNFFKSVIPDYANKTHEQRKEWLVEHNIIGDNSKPFGVGYRIPTQGMSSMFAFQVADVLPEQVGDLIIVPREFTAQTGSDFDVDKLYLATMSYKDGVLEQLTNEAFNNRGRSFEEAMDVAEDRQLATGVEDDEIDVTKWLQDAQDIEKENIRGAISNRLLLNYIDIISDRRNYADARGSIDVITTMLQDELLNPVLKTKSESYIVGMSELLPSFQALRKMEFGVGKSGIGPFALNITNLALTQYTHLTLDFGNVGEEYGFGALDQIYGKDGQRISAWLSAMVNAHVDVAKDPYVFDLNVNQTTYNHANLLIRCGMGLSTFTFLAQPALKDYANTINNAGGLYGDNLEGDTPMSEQNKSRKNNIYKLKIYYYRRTLEKLLEKYKDSISGTNYEQAKKVVEYYSWLTMSAKARRDKGYTNENKPESIRSRKDMFSEEKGKNAILQYKTGADITENNVNGVIESLMYQLFALESFHEIDTFAQQLSQLVQCSQIDTKKFGNTIHGQINFINKYDAFRLNSTLFTINDEEFLKGLTPKDENKGLTANEISTAALDKYFNELYLNKKLMAATRYTKEILSRQLFSATGVYESLFKNILGIINGFDERTDINGMPNIGYKQAYNAKSIDSFAEGIDNMMRFNSFMTLGSNIYKNEIVKYGSTNMIDFTMGGDINAVVTKFKQLTLGSKEQKSIFVRLAKLISQIKKDPYSEKADGLVDADGNIINDLLLYLNPQTPNDKYPIGRMLLQHSQTENKSSEERRLISAFAQLLEHPNEDVRSLAKDIAFYAYFSTYDQNTANSFFHLIPYEYRKQYDVALKNSLEALSSRKQEIKAQAIRNVGGLNVYSTASVADAEMAAASNMIDVLSRNYWFDDNLVPVHYITNSPTTKGFQSSPSDDEKEEFTGPSIYDAASGRTFPTYIATSTVKNNSIYIKIRKGSGTFLYKRVGVVNRFYTDKKGNRKQSNSYYIYVAIPKAGIHTRGINQFELYADYNTPSIFEENKLERDYAEDLVRKDVEDMINDQVDGYYQLEIQWDYDQVPQMYTSSNTSTYREDPTMVPDKRKVNGITVYSKKDPEKVGQNNADVIIDITNNKTTGDVQRPNVKQDFVDKVVELPLDGNLDDVVAAIRRIKDSDVKIHVTTPMFDGQFNISDEEYEDYVKEQLRQYSSQLGNDVLDADSLLKAKEDSIRSNKWTRRNIAQQKINDLLHDLTQRLILSGVTITRYSSAAKNGKTQLPIAISYVKSVDGIYLDSDKNTVFVDREVSGDKKKFRNLLSKLDYTPKQIQSEYSEDDAIVEIPEEKLETSVTNVENIVAKQSGSRFAIGATEEFESGEQVVNFTSSRYGDGYEVSSAGDSRFSAMTATFKPGTVLFGHDVSGRTIESVYQHGVKQNDWVTDNNKKTGVPTSKEIIKGDTEQSSYEYGYLPLWIEWARQNPELIQELRENAAKKGILTDKFAKTYVSQARALAQILNEGIVKQEEELPKILKEAQEKEKNKEKSENNKCSSVGRSKFAQGANTLIIEE